MAASTQSTLESIERRRVQLQENVEKLRKALTHWTTWEAEYQTLREELDSAEDASPTQIREIAQGLDSSLLDSKEAEELLGKDLKTKRTANQVVDIISRRIDYVQQNSATIEKQLDAAEKQLAGVDVLLEPGLDNEEGLPMMDIEEELDEEGKEVASSVNQTGKAAAELVEVLRKAGIQKAELDKKNADTAKFEEDLHVTPPASRIPSQNPAKNTTTISKNEGEPPTDVGQDSKPTRKTVSFAEDSKPEASKPLSSREALEKYGYNDELADISFKHGTKVIELDHNDNEIASYPIIPQGESPEDAELRRQMLQYGLSEVGQIVAELDLDHPTVEYSEGEDEEDYGDETDDDDEEDQYGRSTRPVVTDDYREQMLELEKKLNARMMENVGPEAGDDSLAEHTSDIRTLRIREDDQFDEALGTGKAEPTATESKKKGVRFADELNVSEVPEPVRQPATKPVSSTKPASTVSDTIVERSALEPIATAAPSKPAKVSRFKSARAGASQPGHVLPTPPVPEAPAVPSGPTGRTLATTVLEHNPSEVEPNPPDEFDPIILNHEIQADYHKARNKFIQQQGGFKPTQEDLESPLVEEKDGKTKKVSRFMASRVKANGM